MTEVRDFFERSAEAYWAVPAGMAPYHRVTATRIEAGLQGDVLSIGGVWSQASERLDGVRLVVADLSLAMLRLSEGPEGARVACDGCEPAFAAESFDHVILPLVVHHVTGRTFGSAQRGARRLLRAVRPLLRRGGRLWISDFCTSRPIYALQRLCAPITRTALALLGEPLVIMHTERFYREALAPDRWREVSVDPVLAGDARPWDWIRPVIAAPWLRVPRFTYPLRPTLISAVAS